MTDLSPLRRRAPIRAAAATILAVGLGACVAPMPPPQQIDATEPKVTYSYATDQDLIEVTRKAETYCAKYATWPRNSGITQGPDGTKSVQFTCDRPIAAAPPPPPRPVPPTVSYSYRTDRELVEVSRSAQAYCQQFGASARSGHVTQNVDGTRTVAFDCHRPT